MNYVLDAQTALAWHYADEATPALDSLLDGFESGNRAFVPTIFLYEVANSLVVNERKKAPRSTPVQSGTFLAQLKALPIETDSESSGQAWQKTMELARRHRLSVYDAAYLELSLRSGLPLASADPLLVPAAKKEGVALVLQNTRPGSGV